jgi:hypothetical protein
MNSTTSGTDASLDGGEHEIDENVRGGTEIDCRLHKLPGLERSVSHDRFVVEPEAVPVGVKGNDLSNEPPIKTVMPSTRPSTSMNINRHVI